MSMTKEQEEAIKTINIKEEKMNAKRSNRKNNK